VMKSRDPTQLNSTGQFSDHSTRFVELPRNVPCGAVEVNSHLLASL